MRLSGWVSAVAFLVASDPARAKASQSRSKLADGGRSIASSLLTTRKYSGPKDVTHERLVIVAFVFLNVPGPRSTENHTSIGYVVRRHGCDSGL